MLQIILMILSRKLDAIQKLSSNAVVCNASATAAAAVQKWPILADYYCLFLGEECSSQVGRRVWESILVFEPTGVENIRTIRGSQAVRFIYETYSSFDPPVWINRTAHWTPIQRSPVRIPRRAL
ncbi:uncharacterized protein LOC120420840 [Culex pipiens pallens]|uniref:uncharacterized protein LOC120420840 n=1 Tax=Culex pipiens pallens TaxID=42434 RepID=UPI0022AA93C8|nr:uncharacterized protein LOC120420840 [Culex pipiens pallens]